MTFYRSPSQSADEFENFLNKVNLTMILMPGHQNGGQMIKRLKKVLKWKTCSQFSLSKIINGPTHISDIDVLFTNQQNLITDSGIHLSLHSSCHHQIFTESLI